MAAVRAEVQTDAGTNEPHLIGICMDVTEQKKLAEQSRTADLRLRDAIENISEAFVLWDADNHLVMCNSNYRRLHQLPDHVVQSGTPYATVMSSASQPIISEPEEGDHIDSDMESSYKVRWKVGVGCRFRSAVLRMAASFLLAPTLPS